MRYRYSLCWSLPGGENPWWGHLALPLPLFAAVTLGLTLLVASTACDESPQPPSQPAVPQSAPGRPGQPDLPRSIVIGGPPSGGGPIPTPYFREYWGTAAQGEALAAVGTLVEAFNPRGELVGRFTVNTPGYFGYMRVYGEDATATPPIPGMREGEQVKFVVGGKETRTLPAALWQNNPEPTRVDLAMVAGATATPTPPPANPARSATPSVGPAGASGSPTPPASVPKAGLAPTGAPSGTATAVP